jgi:hypothetical protein
MKLACSSLTCAPPMLWPFQVHAFDQLAGAGAGFDFRILPDAACRSRVHRLRVAPLFQQVLDGFAVSLRFALRSSGLKSERRFGHDEFAQRRLAIGKLDLVAAPVRDRSPLRS